MFNNQVSATVKSRRPFVGNLAHHILSDFQKLFLRESDVPRHRKVQICRRDKTIRFYCSVYTQPVFRCDESCEALLRRNHLSESDRE